MTEHRIAIEGEPVAKGRPRCTCRRNRWGTPAPYLLTPKKTREAEELIAQSWRYQNVGADRLTGTLAVWITFYESPRPRQKQQDADNLAKLVLDALNGVAWDDDRQVWQLNVTVWRSEPDPRTIVIIRELE